ncbi:hypothetical protein [Vibrio phage vB_VpaP_SJSY21]|nr:hypothetical protein [Vibrio phage vB_VpaP_SJSY21]
MSKMKTGLIAAVAGAIVVAGVAFSNIHIVKDTEVGVLTTMGKIDPKPIGTGPLLTIPFFQDLDVMDATQKKMVFTNIKLTTKTDAASPATGNIIVNYVLNRPTAPVVMGEYGTVENYFDQELKERVVELANKYASGIEDTRELMLTESREGLGQHILDNLQEHAKYVTITQVLPQEIFPHQKIADRIDRSAQRAEDERIEQHNLEVAQKEALTKEAAATGIEKERMALARADQFERQSKASARAFEIKEVSEAELAAKLNEAKGNKALDASLTPTILKKIELENQRILNERWGGQVPQYSIGETPNALWIPNNGVVGK